MMMTTLHIRTKVLIANAIVPTVATIVLMIGTMWVTAYLREQISQIAREAAEKAVDRALAPAHPPIEWLSAKALTPQVKVGGTLEMEYTAKVNRQCPADLRAFLLDTDTDTAVYRFPDAAGGYRRASETPQMFTVRVLIENPPLGSAFPALKPGVYVYRTTAIRYCERIVLDSSIPDVRFEIVP